jgi:hypothetical protein
MIKLITVLVLLFALTACGEDEYATYLSLSSYNVHIFINPSCYLGTIAPVANNMVYTVSEDCTTTCAVLQLDALDSNP